MAVSNEKRCFLDFADGAVTESDPTLPEAFAPGALGAGYQNTPGLFVIIKRHIDVSSQRCFLAGNQV